MIKQVKKVNKENAEEVRNLITSCLRQIEIDYGIQAKAVKITYDGDQGPGLEFEVKLQCKVSSEEAKQILENRKNSRLSRFGLRLGSILIHNRKRYRITDYDEYKKRPVICTDENGKLTMWLESDARQALSVAANGSIF